MRLYRVTFKATEKEWSENEEKAEIKRSYEQYLKASTVMSAKVLARFLLSDIPESRRLESAEYIGEMEE